MNINIRCDILIPIQVFNNVCKINLTTIMVIGVTIVRERRTTRGKVHSATFFDNKININII